MGKFCKNWRKNEDGTTAIEFSLMLMPFLMLLLGIIEISLMYASATLVEGATTSASRMIKTGQLQQSGAGDPEAQFRDAMCAYATVLVNCNELEIEVVPMNTYDDYADLLPQFDDDGAFDSRGFNTGGSDQAVLIRTVFQYRMFTPLVGPLLNGIDGERTFISTIVIQTEPYEFDGV